MPFLFEAQFADTNPMRRPGNTGSTFSPSFAHKLIPADHTQAAVRHRRQLRQAGLFQRFSPVHIRPQWTTFPVGKLQSGLKTTTSIAGRAAHLVSRSFFNSLNSLNPRQTRFRHKICRNPRFEFLCARFYQRQGLGRLPDLSILRRFCKMARQPHEGDPHNDRDFEQRVTNFLKSQRIPGSRSIQAQASQGVVTLRGMVSSFYHRQLCSHASHRVAGVRAVVDEINVVETRTALAAAC